MSCPLYVVDASALLAAWLPHEPRQDRALQLLNDLAEDRVHLCSTSLLHAEILNGMYRRTIGKAGSKISAEEAIETWHAFAQLDIQVMPTDVLGERALKLAIKHRWSATYDMLYLALAEDQNTKLISADVKLQKAVGAERVLLLQDY